MIVFNHRAPFAPQGVHYAAFLTYRVGGEKWAEVWLNIYGTEHRLPLGQDKRFVLMGDLIQDIEGPLGALLDAIRALQPPSRKAWLTRWLNGG